MRIIARSIAGALVGLILPTAATAQVVSGWTTDAVTGAPVNRVEVLLLDTLGERRAAASTDSTGLFMIAVPGPGTYRLEAVRLGYDTVRTRALELTYGEAVQVELRLGARALALEPLTVTVRQRNRNLRDRDLSEFYERAEKYEKRQVGRILMREDLVRKVWTSLGELYARHYMGMFSRTAPTFLRGAGRCEPTVFLDGREVPIEVVQDLPLSLLEGVEFWPGIGPPDSRFRARPSSEGVPKLCGVLLVWSRPGGEGWHPPSIGRLAGAVVGAVVLWLVAR